MHAALMQGEQVLWCNQQGAYPHGAQMCTTACMQVGMAVLCGQLDTEAAWRAAAGGDEGACRDFVGALNWCMGASSVVHGRVQTLLARRELLPAAQSRMVSVNELVTVLHIDLPALGVGLDELVLCKQGLSTRLLERTGGLLYEPESCFIGLSHLPLCMRKGSGACVALVTANLHTVCAVCSGGEQYALFDPMPGQMWVGLSGAQLVNKLQRMLSIPSALRGSREDISIVERGGGKKKRRNKMAKSSGGSAQWEDCGDGVQRCRSDGAREAAPEHAFYGDVTLLHVKNK